jgi:hypothetical protein
MVCVSFAVVKKKNDFRWMLSVRLQFRLARPPASVCPYDICLLGSELAEWSPTIHKTPF